MNVTCPETRFAKGQEIPQKCKTLGQEFSLHFIFAKPLSTICQNITYNLLNETNGILIILDEVKGPCQDERNFTKKNLNLHRKSGRKCKNFSKERKSYKKITD